MAERPPTKKSREPTTELEVEPDSGEIELPPARPMGTRERKISVPPPPPPPPARKRVTTPVTPMPESATPEPSVLLGSDAITLEPDWERRRCRRGARRSCSRCRRQRGPERERERGA